MNDIKTVWRWWVGWKIEELENWLEEMEQNEWSLFKFDFNLRFKFKKGESRKIRYCIDFQSKVNDNYYEIFKEDSWELVDNKSGIWFIWRKPYEDERPNIYTDTKSLIERNNRQIRNVIIGVFISLILLYFVLIGNFDGTKLISTVLIMSFVFYGYLMAQYYRYNKKLKQDAIKC
jgi:hypothetical protein